MSAGSMYLVLPVPFRISQGEVLVEAQAANGLDRWADHFSSLAVAAPVVPERLLPQLAGFTWRSLESLEHRERIRFDGLPWTYTPGAFAREWKPTRARLASGIAKADHLQFAIGGLTGDWSSVAAFEAMQQGRKYAIHTDRVEHEVMRKTAAGSGALRRLKIAVEVPLMERCHRHLIRHCSLGLWHGEDCFRAYAPWCHENHLIHDVHTKASDLIGQEELEAKLARIRSGRPLELCYTGRLDPMKAPLEWLRALAAARAQGVALKATWFGEGSMLEEARAEALRLGLDSVVTYAGFVASRPELLAQVRAADALVFTHITPESPRNLLEALVSGTAILGYDNAYAADLLDRRGGGRLVPIHDAEALGRTIAGLDRDRESLAQMTLQAAVNGRRFTDQTVFAERSELVKRFA